MESSALGIVKVFIGASRDLSDAEECIFESNLPPMPDQDEDGTGVGGGKPRPLTRRIWLYLKEMVTGAIKGSGIG